MTAATTPVPRAPVVASRRVRSTILVLGSLFTVAALVVGGFRLLTIVAIEHYSVDEQFTPSELADVERVSVSNSAGAVEVVGTAGGARVTLDVTDGLFAADRRTMISDGALQVRASCTLWFTTHCRVDQRIEAPAGLPVQVRGRHHPIEIHGIDAHVRVDGRFGELRVNGVSGPLSIDHGFGVVTATALASEQVDVTHRFGETQLSFDVAPRHLRVEGRFGSTVIEVPDDGTVYQVTGTSSFGSREVGVRTDPTSDRAIHVDSSFGQVVIRYAR